MLYRQVSGMGGRDDHVLGFGDPRAFNAVDMGGW
jgi:hypothetical protein